MLSCQILSLSFLSSVILLLPYTATSYGVCPVSFCGTLQIKFPFQLTENVNSTTNCLYPGFNLSCSGNQTTSITLSNSGQFTVQDIDYTDQALWVNDPQDCLPARFLRPEKSDSGLTDHPFFVDSTVDYTFVNCSTMTKEMFPYPWYKVVGCLASENYTVLSAPAMYFNESHLPSSCEKIATVGVPRRGSWRNSVEDDVRLRWNQPLCGICKVDDEACGFTNDLNLVITCFNLRGSGRLNGPNINLFLAIGLPMLACIIGLGFFFGKVRSEERRQQAATSSELSTSVGLQPQISIAGLDGTTIASYPKTLLGDSGRLSKPSDNTCSICLCEYEPKESLRTLPQCNHYFHSSCVDEWLRMNASCPLCRDSSLGFVK